jgi:lysophospholipase L1-like esterase
VNRAEAVAAGARYGDILPASRLAAAREHLTASDGLHPSGAMYALWAELALAEALAAVSRPAIFHHS